MHEKSLQRTFRFALMVVFVDALGVAIAIPILPDLIKELMHGDLERTAWYVGVAASSYAFMQLLFAPLLGILSDYWGRKPLLLFSMVFLGIDLIVQAFAPNVQILIAGRILAGVAGASIAVANALTAELSTDANRVKNFGLIGAIYGLGLIAGPALGGILGSIAVRAPLLFMAGLAWLTAAHGFTLSLSAKLASTSTETLSTEEGKPDRFPSVARSFSVLKANALVSYVAVALFFSALAQRGLENLFVIYTSVRFDWTRLQSGLALGLLGLMAVVVQGILARPVIAFAGERPTALAAALLLAAAMLGFSLADQGWMLYPILAVGSFSGLAGVALQSIVNRQLSPRELGTVQGILVSTVSLASAIAPYVFTSILFGKSLSNSEDATWKGAPFAFGSLLVCFSILILWFALPKLNPASTDLSGPT